MGVQKVKIRFPISWPGRSQNPSLNNVWGRSSHFVVIPFSYFLIFLSMICFNDVLASYLYASFCLPFPCLFSDSYGASQHHYLVFLFMSLASYSDCFVASSFLFLRFIRRYFLIFFLFLRFIRRYVLIFFLFSSYLFLFFLIFLAAAAAAEKIRKR